MTNVSQPQSAKSVSWIRRVVTYALVLLIGFVLGFVPMWVKSRESASNLAAATNQLSLAKVQSSLASAAIDAHRGDYEPARQAASSFFTSLRAETDRGADSILSQAQREGAPSLFTLQDEIITLLARNDPAASERLSDLYVSFRELMSK